MHSAVFRDGIAMETVPRASFSRRRKSRAGTARPPLPGRQQPPSEAATDLRIPRLNPVRGRTAPSAAAAAGQPHVRGPRGGHVGGPVPALSMAALSTLPNLCLPTSARGGTPRTAGTAVATTAAGPIRRRGRTAAPNPRLAPRPTEQWPPCTAPDASMAPSPTALSLFTLHVASM